MKTWVSTPDGWHKAVEETKDGIKTSTLTACGKRIGNAASRDTPPEGATKCPTCDVL